MVQERSTRQASSMHSRRQILDAAIQLYREIGYRKTTVADIARRTRMSPANVYRFFRSRQDIEEGVVAELLDEMCQAAANAARGSDSPQQRLRAVLSAISQLHELRAASDRRLHELLAAATDANWPVVLAYVDQVIGILAPIIVAGQGGGKVRDGSAATLASCLLAAMSAHVSARDASAAGARPSFGQMMDFCANALCLAVSRSGEI